MEGECLPQKPGNYSNTSTPNSVGALTWRESEPRAAGNWGSPPRSHSRLKGRGGAAGDLGNPPRLQSGRMVGAAAMYLQPRGPGPPQLPPCIPPRLGGPCKESPPLPIIPAPNPSTWRAVAPEPWLAVVAPEPFEAPSPLPWPCEPPPQLRPPPRPARGSGWTTDVSLPRKRRDQART